MTLSVMADFGVEVDCNNEFTSFSIPTGCYRSMDYQIEGDASNASYFWAAAAVTGGRVTVTNVPVPSLQGDADLVPLLARMGCEVSREGAGISVSGRERLEGITVDMGNMPDVVPTLAVVAAFAEGTTVIENVAHLREKESDRLGAVAAELMKMGIETEVTGAGLRVTGGHPHGAVIDTYNDHRLAMSFAVAGLRVPGMVIRDETCVAKSFPDFWEVFDGLAG